MKKIFISLFLLLFVLVGSAWAPVPKFGTAIQKLAYTTDDLMALREKVINHPEVYKDDNGWYRVVIDENVSQTAYRWRWDIRMIEFWGNDAEGIHFSIAHRQYQDTAHYPTSATVVETIYTDYFIDGKLDRFIKDRFMTVKTDKDDTAGDYIITLTWADGFNFPEDRAIPEETQQKMFEEEIQYWQDKLQ